MKTRKRTSGPCVTRPDKACATRSGQTLVSGIGTAALFLLLFAATGCSAVRAPELLKLTPPPALLQEEPFPAWTGQTNGDLLEYAKDLETALDLANAKLRAVSAWAKGE